MCCFRLPLLPYSCLSCRPDPVQAQSQGPPFLWEISGTRTSYLFGTVHLPDPRVANLPASVNRAFKASQAVYTEIPLDPSSVVNQVPRLMLSGPRTLPDIVPADLLQRTEEALRKINSALTIRTVSEVQGLDHCNHGSHP